MSKLGILARVVATILVAAGFVVAGAVWFAFLPARIVAASRGYKTGHTYELVAAGAALAFVWRLWRPERLATEIAYGRGLERGMLRAAEEEGRKEGERLISKHTDLRPRPNYKVR